MKTTKIPRRPAQPLYACLLSVVLFAPVVTLAQSNFSSGTVRISGSASASEFLDEIYVRIGLGMGYYVTDGLELGLDIKSWVGGDLNVYEIEPSATYVFNDFDKIMPYAGLLYRRTIYEGYDDESALGARAGLFLQQSRNLYLRMGVVGIKSQRCNNINSDCSDLYPEISAGLYF